MCLEQQQMYHHELYGLKYNGLFDVSAERKPPQWNELLSYIDGMCWSPYRSMVLLARYLGQL